MNEGNKFLLDVERTVTATLRYDLTEAKLEIDRHHKDFEKIKEILSVYESYTMKVGMLDLLIKEMRNIIG